MHDRAELISTARLWASQDPDETTRAEVARLLTRLAEGDADAENHLVAQFSARLTFGTAGLRAELGAGPARMNRVVVSQTTAGLVRHLNARRQERVPHLVVGYDARTNSWRFAEDVAEIAAGAGARVTLLPRQLATPVLAFAVRHFDADAGVMITASHNRARDNGYKVYLGGPGNDGSQIVSPDDRDIAEHIDVITALDARELPRSRDFEIAAESVVEAYIDRAAAVRCRTDGAGAKFVYTPMHGVGWEVFRKVARQAGFATPVPVQEQITPDPQFPTLSLPNPEEPGALDLAISTAKSTGASLILANDPDADRLAVAVADPSASTGFRQLTGNEVGLLLGWRRADILHDTGRAGSLARSLVSSPALDAVADVYGLPVHETGTGFKWISRAPDITFGFEEAIGYLVDPDSVRDKDGISAAVAILDLVNELAATDKTLLDRLTDAAGRFGAYASAQTAHSMADPDRPAALATLKETPPASIGGLVVRSATTVGDGSIVKIELDKARLMTRASGTEPKVKFYLDAWSTEGLAEDRQRAAEHRLELLRTGVIKLLSSCSNHHRDERTRDGAPETETEHTWDLEQRKLCNDN